MSSEFIKDLEQSLLIALGHTLPYKDLYHELKTGSSTTAVWTNLVPEGEIWEINTLFSGTSATNSPVGTFMRQDKSGAVERYFHRGSGGYIQWVGKLLLPVNNRIRVLWDTIGNVTLHVLGVKRVAPSGMSDLLHGIKPIVLPTDIQQPDYKRPDIQEPCEKKVWWWPF